MSWKKIFAAVIAPVATLAVVGAAPWVSGQRAAAQSAPAQSAPAQSAPAPVNVEASAPQMINGYTLHGGQQMAERGISEEEADAVVGGTWLSAVYSEPEDTWRYTGGGHFPGVVIVLNNGGQVVTAWRL